MSKTDKPWWETAVINPAVKFSSYCNVCGIECCNDDGEVVSLMGTMRWIPLHADCSPVFQGFYPVLSKFKSRFDSPERKWLKPPAECTSEQRTIIERNRGTSDPRTGRSATAAATESPLAFKSICMAVDDPNGDDVA